MHTINDEQKVWLKIILSKNRCKVSGTFPKNLSGAGKKFSGQTFFKYQLKSLHFSRSRNARRDRMDWASRRRLASVKGETKHNITKSNDRKKQNKNKTDRFTFTRVHFEKEFFPFVHPYQRSSSKIWIEDLIHPTWKGVRTRFPENVSDMTTWGRFYSTTTLPNL